MRLAGCRHLQTLSHPSAIGRPYRRCVSGLHYKLQLAQVAYAQFDDQSAAAARDAASLARAALVDVVASPAGHTWAAAAPVGTCAVDMEPLLYDQKQQQQQRQVQD